MTITSAEMVYPERRALSVQQVLELEQMLDQGDACLRGLPYRHAFTHLVQARAGAVYLVIAGRGNE